MLMSRHAIEDRVRTCVSDLQDNGINLAKANDGFIREVVVENLDYFQLMLGYDTDVRSLISLIKAQRDERQHA